MTFRVEDAGDPMLAKMYDLAREVYDHFRDLGHELDVIYGSTTIPDHNNLRCLDFSSAHANVRATGKEIAAAPSMVLGTAIANYCWEHRERFGLNLEIWNRRIRRTYNKPGIPAGTWATYTGSDNPHTDHVHIECDDSKFTPLKPTKTLGVLIMADGATKIYHDLATAWTPIAAGEHDLKIDEPEPGGKTPYSIWSGPTPGIDVVCGIEIKGLPAGGVATLFFGRIDWDGNDWKMDHPFDTPGGQDIIGRADGKPVQGQVSFKDTMGKPKTAGHQFRLRIFLRTPVAAEYKLLTRGWVIEP